eukprot:14703843-Alexandrium_andersonii.AAC.1
MSLGPSAYHQQMQQQLQQAAQPATMQVPPLMQQPMGMVPPLPSFSAPPAQGWTQMPPQLPAAAVQHPIPTQAPQSHGGTPTA